MESVDLVGLVCRCFRCFRGLRLLSTRRRFRSFTVTHFCPISITLHWTRFTEGSLTITFFPIFSGFTKFFPVALACLTLVPCLAAVHWSYSVNPIYAKTRKSVEKPPKDRNTRWVTVWSIFSAFTRIATLALLIFIYYEHWKDVQVSFSKLLEVWHCIITGNWKKQWT